VRFAALSSLEVADSPPSDPRSCPELLLRQAGLVLETPEHVGERFGFFVRPPGSIIAHARPPSDNPMVQPDLTRAVDIGELSHHRTTLPVFPWQIPWVISCAAIMRANRQKMPSPFPCFRRKRHIRRRRRAVSRGQIRARSRRRYSRIAFRVGIRASPLTPAARVCTLEMGVDGCAATRR